jgi:hypothetical protein
MGSSRSLQLRLGREKQSRLASGCAVGSIAAVRRLRLTDHIPMKLVLWLLFALSAFAQAHYYTGAPGVELPDPKYTPGATLTHDSTVVCQKAYAGRVRNVSEATKKQVFRLYGIDPNQSAHFEVDHLISLELGGSNDIHNLWPQPYSPAPGAHEKDKLEDHLHTEVCAGKITLTDAQHLISTNWYVAWKGISQ